MKNIKHLTKSMSDGLDELISRIIFKEEERKENTKRLQKVLRVLHRNRYNISPYKEIYSDLKQEYGL